MEDVEKVQKLLNELNAKEAPLHGLGGAFAGPWVHIQGYFAITGFDFKEGGNIFNPSFGVPVKVFMNNKTGEIKIYSAFLFEKKRKRC